jgi:hypothetical protein
MVSKQQKTRVSLMRSGFAVLGLPEPQHPLQHARTAGIAYGHSRSADRNTEKCKTVNSSVPASLLNSTDILLLAPRNLVAHDSPLGSK